jgi:hypothetical protein
LTFEIAIDNVEIVEAKWMLVTEFLQSKQAGAFEKMLLSKVLGKEGLTLGNAEAFGFEKPKFEIYLS